jgi:hypothetical protein
MICIVVYSHDEMGGACGTCGGKEKCIQGLLRKPEEKKGHLEDLGLDGRIILR